MTRFARASKKTSLEATPWHELVSSGDHGSRTKMAGKKRKKNFNSDEATVALKVSRSEHEKIQSVGIEKKAKSRTVPKKKDFKKRNKTTFNPVKDNSGIMKKNGPKSDLYKHTIKHKSKSPTNAKRTEILDKKLEARKKRRAKRKTCFHCRQTGHLVAECPVVQKTDMGVGNCYKCGSSEHTTKHCTGKSTSDAAFPFAKCFICLETGHIARECPDNPKGLYPNGGGCKICGSVEHFRRDCPQLIQQNKVSVTTAHVQCIKDKKGHFSADAELEDLGETPYRAPKKKGPQIVKF